MADRERWVHSNSVYPSPVLHYSHTKQKYFISQCWVIYIWIIYLFLDVVDAFSFNLTDVHEMYGRNASIQIQCYAWCQGTTLGTIIYVNVVLISGMVFFMILIWSVARFYQLTRLSPFVVYGQMFQSSLTCGIIRVLQDSYARGAKFNSCAAIFDNKK